MNRVMLDASALVTVLCREPGYENVPVASGEAAISTVNYAEVASVMTLRGMPVDELHRETDSFILDIVEFTRESAEAAGFLIAKTRPFGLSLGDRACLAEAARRGVPALTADRAWKGIDVGVTIRFVR